MQAENGVEVLFGLILIFSTGAISTVSRGMIRVKMLQDQQFGTWIRQTFAIGPRLTLLATGLAIGHLWHFRWLVTRCEYVLLGFIVLILSLLFLYLVSELLEGAFLEPHENSALTPRSIGGLWAPLAISASAHILVFTFVILMLVSNWQEGPT